MAEWKTALAALVGALAVAACGGGSSGPDGGADTTSVGSDAGAQAKVVGGFSGQTSFRLPDDATTLGSGADGQGGIAIGARFRARNARVTVYDASGTVIGSAPTGDAGLVTFRPDGGSLAGIGVEIRGGEGATLYDAALDREVPFPADVAWRAVVERIDGNIGLGPLSEMLVARAERLAGLPVAGALTGSAHSESVAKSTIGGVSAARRPADLRSLLAARQVDGTIRALEQARRELAARMDDSRRASDALFPCASEHPAAPSDAHALPGAPWGAPVPSYFEVAVRGHQRQGDGCRNSAPDPAADLASRILPVLLDEGRLIGHTPSFVEAGLQAVRDFAADGRRDCALDGLPMRGADGGVLRCDAGPAEIATILRRLGLPPTVETSLQSTRTTTITRDGGLYLVEQDINGGIYRAAVASDGSLGTRERMLADARLLPLNGRNALAVDASLGLVFFGENDNGFLDLGAIAPETRADIPLYPIGTLFDDANRDAIDRAIDASMDDNEIVLLGSAGQPFACSATARFPDVPFGRCAPIAGNRPPGASLPLPAFLADIDNRDGNFLVIDVDDGCATQGDARVCPVPGGGPLFRSSVEGPDTVLFDEQRVFVRGDGPIARRLVGVAADARAFVPVSLAGLDPTVVEIRDVYSAGERVLLSTVAQPTTGETGREILILEFSGDPADPFRPVIRSGSALLLQREPLSGSVVIERTVRTDDGGAASREYLFIRGDGGNDTLRVDGAGFLYQ